MPDFVSASYAQTGVSTLSNALGMRAMQERAYEARNAQYLLVKAPPASGKSRALMFVALDKLANQGVRKVIVAVPERSIGASFRSTELSRHGFHSDWIVDPRWNLCTGVGESSKVKALETFLASDDEALVCTHATLRFAFDKLGATAFDGTLLAIDEFHHASADVGSRLGELVRAVMEHSDAHIVAMTGSYFRGDTTPVLRAEDEARFSRVTFTYYEQLDGYSHLKSLGIGYHFYRKKYVDAISEVLDPSLKTIIHIPSVRSGESLGDKYGETDRIGDVIGEFVLTDPVTGFHHLRRHSDGAIVKVADLVNDDPKDREKVIQALRNVESRDEVDIVIALGMAKEGFDWIWCEHALTVGYRGSLTEIVQIIGRATRDAPGKEHAQFTNLIAEPDATDTVVTKAVNDMLKAIACSLLMEQVLAPNFKFKTRDDTDENLDGSRKETEIRKTAGTVEVSGFKEPTTERARGIIESDLADLKASILQDPKVIKAAMSPEEFAPETVSQVLIPQVIRTRYPDLSEDEVEVVRQHVMVDTTVKAGSLSHGSETSAQHGSLDEDAHSGDRKFIRMAGRFVRLDQLSIDLIDSINPFYNAYEILSKSLSSEVLKRIHTVIESTRIEMTDDEAVMLWPRIQAFKEQNGTLPSLTSLSPIERRMAEAVAYLTMKKAERKRSEANAA